MVGQIYPFINVGGGHLRPLVPINIVNPATKAKVRYHALLDTGADACVFPKYVCDKLGYRLKEDAASTAETVGVGGTAIPIHHHNFIIELVAPDNLTVVWKSKVLTIGCLEHDNAHPILGWEGFLSHFTIRFNQTTNKIVMELPIVIGK